MSAEKHERLSEDLVEAYQAVRDALEILERTAFPSMAVLVEHAEGWVMLGTLRYGAIFETRHGERGVKLENYPFYRLSDGKAKWLGSGNPDFIEVRELRLDKGDLGGP